MARRFLLLLMGAVAPTVTACASAGPAPMVLARADAAVPPVPADLLGPVNGKADAPFQVEAMLVLAAQMQRQSSPAAPRAAPLSTARAPAAPAAAAELAGTTARVQVARAAAPAATRARGSRPAGSQSADGAAFSAPDLPAAPTPYAQLVRASLPTAALDAPPPPGPQVAGAPTLDLGVARVRTLAAHRRLAKRNSSTVRPAAAGIVQAAAPAPRTRAIAPRHAGVRTPPPQAAMITRIRAIITGWLSAIRV